MKDLSSACVTSVRTGSLLSCACALGVILSTSSVSCVRVAGLFSRASPHPQSASPCLSSAMLFPVEAVSSPLSLLKALETDFQVISSCSGAISFSGRSLIHGWCRGFWQRCCSLDISWQVMASSILAKFKTLVVAGEAAGGSLHCLLWWVMCSKLWHGSGFPSQWVSLLMWKRWWSAVVSNESLEESAGVVLCPSLFYDGSGGQGQVGGITGAQSRPWFTVTNWSSKESLFISFRFYP